MKFKPWKKYSFIEFMKVYLIDLISLIFVFVGMWAVVHGLLAMYESYYQWGSVKPSVLGDSSFWIVEGIFFLLLGMVTYKEKKFAIPK